MSHKSDEIICGVPQVWNIYKECPTSVKGTYKVSHKSDEVVRGVSQLRITTNSEFVEDISRPHWTCRRNTTIFSNLWDNLAMSSDLCNTLYVFIEFVEHLFQLHYTCGIPITITSDLWDTFYDFIKFVGKSLWFPWVRETFFTTSSDL